MHERGIVGTYGERRAIERDRNIRGICINGSAGIERNNPNCIEAGNRREAGRIAMQSCTKQSFGYQVIVNIAGCEAW